MQRLVNVYGLLGVASTESNFDLESHKTIQRKFVVQFDYGLRQQAPWAKTDHSPTLLFEACHQRGSGGRQIPLMHALETAEVWTKVYLSNRIVDWRRIVVLQPAQTAPRYAQTV